MGKDIVPRCVRRFEYLMYLTLAIGLVVASLQYDSVHSKAVDAFGQENAGTFILFVQTAVFISMLTIALLITRKRSRIAKWIYVVMFILGIPMYVPQLLKMFSNGPSGYFSSAQTIVQCYMIYLLFTKDFKKWMDRNK
jgi:hypothetical protein